VLGQDNAVAGERSHRAVHSQLQIFVLPYGYDGADLLAMTSGHRGS